MKSDASDKALRWLLEARGKEGHWFWRWKFKTADRNVRFDPDKYGWPWISGSASSVIPTAFSIIGEANPHECRDASGPRMRGRRMELRKQRCLRSRAAPAC